MSFAAACFSLCCRDSVVRAHVESKGRRKRDKEKGRKIVETGTERLGMERTEVFERRKVPSGVDAFNFFADFLPDSEDLWSLRRSWLAPVFFKLNLLSVSFSPANSSFRDWLRL